MDYYYLKAFLFFLLLYNVYLSTLEVFGVAISSFRCSLYLPNEYTINSMVKFGLKKLTK